MATTVKRPDSTFANEWTVVPGGNAWAVTSDDDDDTYLLGEDPGSQAQVGTADPSGDIPAGAVVTQATVLARLIRGWPALTRVKAEASDSGHPGEIININWSEGWQTIGVLLLGHEQAAAWLGGPRRIRLTQLDGGPACAELIVIWGFVLQPEVVVDGPTGTLTEHNRPLVEWTPDLEGAGGGQTRFEVKVFDDATATGGGFDPDTSAPVEESGVVASSAASWKVDEPVANGDYHAYVRVAQTVNGQPHWSDWESSAFTVDVTPPKRGLTTPTSEDGQGRVRLEIEPHPADGGAPTPEAYEVKRSLDDGETWAHIRTLDGGGIVPADGGGEATVFDYEGPNGETVAYRVRGLIHDGDVSSDWLESNAMWSSEEAWVKHPFVPDLNVTVRVHDFGHVSRASGATVQKVLGREDPIVTRDSKRILESGDLDLRVDTTEEHEALRALLDAGDPLLLQFPPSAQEHDRWIVHVGDHGRSRIVEKLYGSPRVESVPWQEVDSPEGDIDAWPEEE